MRFEPGTAKARPRDFKVGQRVRSFAGMEGTVQRVSVAKRGQSAGLNFITVAWENGHIGRRQSSHVGNIEIVS